MSTTSSDQPAKMDAWLYIDEITHRTLNEYAIMLSMLRQASRSTTDAAGSHALGAVAKRLEASAAAFCTLRPSREQGPCYLDDDLERLCASLTESVLADRSIGLTLISERVRLSAQRCWQICLIVSELVMNAAKHAFTATCPGEIVVKVCIVGGSIQCAVADNGLAGPDAKSGRGSGIIDALAAELRGTIARNLSARGSTIVLRAPIA